MYQRSSKPFGHAGAAVAVLLAAAAVLSCAVNGTYAAQGKSDQKIQALTFHQVSPRLLVFASIPPQTEIARQNFRYAGDLFATLLDVPKQQARQSVAKPLRDSHASLSWLMPYSVKLCSARWRILVTVRIQFLTLSIYT